MPHHPVPPSRSLDRLRKDAKRWHDALAAGDADARQRYARLFGDVPPAPTLRAVQHALAREHGFPGWVALTRAVGASAADRATAVLSIEDYEEKAVALLEAYRTGTEEAMERHYRHTWHRRSWPAMRTYVQLDLGKRPESDSGDVEITPDDARHLIALEHGFADWQALMAFTLGVPQGARLALKPVRLLRGGGDGGEATTVFRSRDWAAIIAALQQDPSAALGAHGQMTDAVLADLSRVEGLTALDLSGSRAVTDEGVRHLARTPGLRALDLSGTGITDRGLPVLRALSALETLSLAGTRITDAGLAPLEGCAALQRLNLSFTETGDGALRALAGKAHLRHLATGQKVSDAGLRLLHELPAFRSWQGGTVSMALLGFDSEPTHLLLRGRVTDNGLRHLEGLEGLSGLNIDDRRLSITAAALTSLATLPHLVWLAVDAHDDWMPGIAALPHLRFLMVQDTDAGDDGFVALSRSRTLEYIWGRRCHNLRRRGFRALAGLPALRGLSVSCLNVDDEGIAALPSFTALRELMPMDVPDAGYRHIGRCTELESLILMYCRDTTDAATEQIAGLPKLRSYFNSYTAITDRTPGVLSRMDLLEEITFDTCHGLTDAGLARLARLPRLRRLRASGRRLTPALRTAFPAGVAIVGDD